MNDLTQLRPSDNPYREALYLAYASWFQRNCAVEQLGSYQWGRHFDRHYDRLQEGGDLYGVPIDSSLPDFLSGERDLGLWFHAWVHSCPDSELCQRIRSEILAALEEDRKEAEVVKVEDLEKITEYAVMTTPALVVDGEVKASGKALSVEQIKKYI